MSYAEFFELVTGNRPFPYQQRLGSGDWPEVIDVPTGLGKTEAVIVAWLYRLLEREGRGGRRLVYCLPMRVLVEQTVGVAARVCERATEVFQARGVALPSVHALLGGYVDERWEEKPDEPAILVGTQDMLLSRALCRGYAMSRFKWPIQFGLLHNDCVWVFDETQLMGVGVETSAQLEGLRRKLGTLGDAHSIWMSATLGRRQLATVDHPEPSGGFRVSKLEADDRDAPLVQMRTGATKALAFADVVLTKNTEGAYVTELSGIVRRAHSERGGLTLVIVNRVARAQAVYEALRDQGIEPLGLIHSRFREVDRKRHERILQGDAARVVVATQAVEAGVDVSARTLVTELAPWPSLVQRIGRCNRYGTEPDAQVFWVDIDVEDESRATPYEASELVASRKMLTQLQDVGPGRLQAVEYSAPTVVRPVLRRRDLLDLFDTTPDLLGNDVDVSRFVRDGDDTDVQVYFRAFDGAPDASVTAPSREELVRVSIGAARDLIARLDKKRRSLGDGKRDVERKRWLRAWTWRSIATEPWERATSAHPGQVLLLHCEAGGYDVDLGWTGELLPKRKVEAVTPAQAAPTVRELMDADPRTAIDRWVRLSDHLEHVKTEAEQMVRAVDLPPELSQAVVTAALWHDLGKVHAEFQRRLLEPVVNEPELAAPDAGPWAKSSHSRRPPNGARSYFRHELASALAWLQCQAQAPLRDLVAYLIAAHHGKVRMSIRSVPNEWRPPEPERLFARGVWHGDVLAVAAAGLPGVDVETVELDLRPMQLGEGSWLERTLALRDDPALGPFRLALLETLVRVADWRATEKERHDA